MVDHPEINFIFKNKEDEAKDTLSKKSSDNIIEKPKKTKRIMKEIKNLQNYSRKYQRNVNMTDQSNDVCTVCEQTSEFKKMLVCRSCKFKKCQECAAKEEQFSSTVFDGSKYKCTSCIEYQKPGKKEHYSKRNLLGNKRGKKRMLEKISQLEKSFSPENFEEEEEEKCEFNFINEINDFKETGLDIDLLHKTVSPPSELYKSDDNTKPCKSNKLTRKSERVQKKEKNNLFQFINCHQCKKIDNSVNMTTCSKDSCRESYCFNCIKKYFPKNPEGYNKFKNSEKGDWVCFVCTSSCLCKNCGARHSDKLSKKNDKLNSNKSHNSIIIIPNNLSTNIDNSNVVKIDDYIIYEGEGPEDESDINHYDHDEQSNIEQKEKPGGMESINDHKSYLYIKNVEIYCKKESKKFNKLCIMCKHNIFMNNEILKFKCFEEFLHYVKYNIDKKSSQFNQEANSFKKNKEYFQDFFNNYQNYHKSECLFRTGKHICKTCFVSNLSSENGFINLCKALKIPQSILSMKGMKFEESPEIKIDLNSKNVPKKVENHENFLLEQLSDSKKVFSQLNNNKKRYDDIIVNTLEEPKSNFSQIKTKEIEKIITKPEEVENPEKRDNIMDYINLKSESITNPQGMKIVENSTFIKNIQNPLNIQQIHKMNQNMSNVNSGLFKYVDSIAQFNQKNLINNNLNLSSNLNQILSMAQNNNELNNSENTSHLVKNDENKENQNIDNDQKINNESIDKENVNVCNIIMNVDQNKQNNNQYISTLIDDLKKQIFSIQFYSLIQRNFISYIFKNLEIFIDQITNNQVMNELVVNNLVKLLPKSPNLNITSDCLNNINEQVGILRKINLLGSNVTSSLNANFEEIKNSGYRLICKPENSFPQNNPNGCINPLEYIKNPPNIFPNKAPMNMNIPLNNMSNIDNFLKQNQMPLGPLPMFDISKQKMNGMMMNNNNNNQGTNPDLNAPSNQGGNLNSLILGLNNINNPMNSGLSFGINQGFNMISGFPHLPPFPMPSQMNLGFLNQNNLNLPNFFKNNPPNNYNLPMNSLLNNLNSNMMNNFPSQSMGMNPPFNPNQNQQSSRSDPNLSNNNNNPSINGNNTFFNENPMIQQIKNNNTIHPNSHQFKNIFNPNSQNSTQTMNNPSNENFKYLQFNQGNELGPNFSMFNNPNNFNLDNMIQNNNIDMFNNYIRNNGGAGAGCENQNVSQMDTINIINTNNNDMKNTNNGNLTIYIEEQNK